MSHLTDLLYNDGRQSGVDDGYGNMGAEDGGGVRNGLMVPEAEQRSPAPLPVESAPAWQKRRWHPSMATKITQTLHAFI